MLSIVLEALEKLRLYSKIIHIWEIAHALKRNILYFSTVKPQKRNAYRTVPHAVL